MEINTLLSGTETIIGKEELVEKISSGAKLKVKFGVDPTRPDLTFGHLVVFNKLKQFQDAGHDAILLIGFLSIPVLVEAKNMTLSIPSIEQSSKSISSDLMSKIAFSNFK